MAESAINKQQRDRPRLQMHNIHKNFGATRALVGVNFDVRPGEVHALVGENGAGKSTLMKILSGAHQPDAGEMVLDGQPYQPRHPLEARQQGLGMIYQELTLALHLSVEENILLGVEPRVFGFIKRGEMRKRSVAALQQLQHSEIQPTAKVRDLSVGERQLVEIARFLAVGCRVLVFDEPTSSLSHRDIERLFEIIRRLKSQGLAIVYISHFLEEVEQIADRITVLRDGKVTGVLEKGEADRDHIVRLMVGREVDALYPRCRHQRGELVLEINQLSGQNKPVDASLRLFRGEVLGICGLVGAGRTELLRAIFGLDAVKSGAIKIGVYAGIGTPVQRWQQGAGMLSENRKEEGLALNLTITDNMTMTKLQGFGPVRLVLPKKQNAATHKWIDHLDIRCNAPEQKVADLSGGNQQKVALARLLQHDVDVLLLDEPTKGVDVAAKARIYQMIDQLAQGDESEGRLPKAILMVSSYLPELLGVCDRIAVMADGHLGESRPVDEWDEHTLMLTATAKE